MAPALNYCRICWNCAALGCSISGKCLADTAVKRNKYLRMIVHLSKPSPTPGSSGMERLTGDLGSRRVLDLDVPMITIPVMAGPI